MSWILIAIIAYFFLALVNIGDKLLLGNFIPNYKAYSALVAVLGMAVFVLAPWFLSWPGLSIFMASILAGAMFIVSLLAFFYSLQLGEASRVIPFVGGLIPIFSLVLAVIFLQESLTSRQLLAFLFLLIGSVVIVRMPHKTHWWHNIWEKIHATHHEKEIVVAVLAALAFAITFVASKYVYSAAGFMNGFIWIRLGSFVAFIGLLLSPDIRAVFMQAVRKILSKKGWIFLGNQGFGAIGAFMQNWAIALGSVALVNALQGVQYVFVIGLAGLAAIKFPKIAGNETLNLRVIIEKVIAVIIIGVGLWFLTF